MNDPAPPRHDVTRLLQEWQDGSREALDRLIPLVYDELHALASRHLSREWRHSRPQTTVVLNEATCNWWDSGTCPGRIVGTSSRSPHS